MESSPTTCKGTAKVELGRGIKIYSIYYSAPQIRQSGVEGTQVKVRYDPFDIGRAYAWVAPRWVPCVSQYHSTLQGHTEKEMMLASKEIRRQNQLHATNAAVTARRLADFLAHVDAHQAIRQQRLRDLEARAVLDAIAGEKSTKTSGLSASSELQASTASVTLQPLPVDLATLPVFEEYH